MKAKPIVILLLFLISGMSYLHSQTTWIKYGKEPVLKRDTNIAHLPNDIYAISDPFVLKLNSIFKMWYTCGGLNFPTDTLLRSRICYCESTDGIHWIKDTANPVLDVSYNGSWDSLAVETPFVLIDSLAPANQRFKMWYAGQYFNAYRYEIGYAYSADGLNWTKYPTPVLKVGSSNDWDGGFLEGPSVIFDDGLYKMWYSGYNLNNGKTNTGYATSTDGIHWTKYAGNPVITVSSKGKWDSYSVQDPHVIKIDSLYQMWYGGLSQDSIYGQEVGYAYSTDGIQWIKSSHNPILKKGSNGSWDANTASFPSVLLDHKVWKMWYTGKDVDPLPINSKKYYWEIGYAYGTTTGLNQFTNQKIPISLYPNPTNGKLNLKFHSFIKKGNFVIYDLMGIAKLSGKIKNLKSLTIELGNLKTGLYFILVDDGSQKSSRHFLHIHSIQ